MMVVRFWRKLTPGEHVPRERNGPMLVEVGVDPVIDRESGRMVAAPQAGHVTHRYIFRTIATEGLVQGAFQIGSASQMARHIGADTHFRLGRRREMKVGIETGYRMDLAERHLNLGGEFMQRVGWQIAELLLNGPEFVDQAPWSSCFRKMMKVV